MDKTQVIHARIEPKLKLAAESVFAQIGLSTTDAIRLFFKQVELHHGMPFDLKIPNKESKKALADIKKGTLKRYKTVDQFRKSLEDL